MPTRHELESLVDERLNDEMGTLPSDGTFRVALVYPSPYQVGMSSLGFQTIYRILNGMSDVACERSFLPDEPEEYRESRTSLFTYESKWSVSDADIVAFSVAYEVEVVGLLECLDLAGIPLRAADRGEGWPLVLFGGPLTFSNPLPIAPFCDVMVMGEGEELVRIIVERWREATDRQRFLEEVARLPGVYVPSIHGERLMPTAQVDDRELPAHAAIVTPNTELRSMHLVENARGCHRGCTFCVMRRTTNNGMRVVDAADVLATIPEHARRVGLVGAATSDHPQILDIVRSIVGSGREVGLSSLRADRLNREFVELLAEGGAKTLTVASDGASERMRKAAKKGIKERHLRHMAELVRDTDMRQLKLYMVFGYPGETMEDIDELVEFVGELSTICRVALGMSPLVAKKRTPLDGAPFEDAGTLQAKLKRIHKAIGSVVDIRSTSVRWSWIEYQLAQGGWGMADAAEQAWRDGGTYGAWKRAIRAHGPARAAIVRPPDERLRPGAMLESAPAASST